MQSPSDNLKGLLRIVSAPMAGISSPAFRVLCQEMGATMTFTEMISSRGLTSANRNTMSLLETARGETAVAAQIFGHRPRDMARAARIVEKSGFRLVDINMGCPVRKVVGPGAGAALLREPGLAADIVSAVRDAVSIPVTAKIRSGWTADRIVAPDLSERLAGAGLSALTVHARTRDQGYGGRADWKVIAEVVERLDIPVVGNGDVVDGPSALRLLDQTGCNGVMVGRASLGNPWVFREIRRFLDGRGGSPQPSRRERFGVFLRHLRGTIRESGRIGGIRRFRTYAAWYTKGISGAPEARRLIQQSRSASEIIRTIKNLYGLSG
jgi:tRNA-dihydrouridine synthase B